MLELELRESDVSPDEIVLADINMLISFLFYSYYYSESLPETCIPRMESFEPMVTML